MVHITLYKSSAENERVNKASYLTAKLEMSGSIKEETSIIRPKITIYQTADITNYNYCKIDEFGGRYYFITDIVCIRNNIYEISLVCDVLYTYMSDIKELKCNVIKQQNDFNKMLNDGTFKTTEEVFTETHKFTPDLIDTSQPLGKYIMTVL